MSDPFATRGNRDASIVNPRPAGTAEGNHHSGPTRPGHSGDPFLIGEGMRGGYGKADILNGCTLAVEKGQIAVIVGPNGAGKSTAMKAVFGMLPLREGTVTLGGQDIRALSPQERVRQGMGFVPQTHNVFPSMSVEENLEMGAFIRDDVARNAALLRLAGFQPE